MHKNTAKISGQISADASNETNDIAKASSDVLRAYKGIKPKKLFANFEEFQANFFMKLETYKDCIPQGLFKQIQTSAKQNDFSLLSKVSEYYSELSRCKTLADIKNSYPEIQVPQMNFKKEIAETIRSAIPRSICDKAATLQTFEEKRSYIAKYLNSVISKQVNTWEILPEFRKITATVIEDIAQGKFIGIDFEPKNIKLYNNKMPLRFRFLHVDNPEDAMITMIKQHYIDGKNLTEIKVNTTDGKEIYAHRLNQNERFKELDKHFRMFLKNSEESAAQFRNLSQLDKVDISSAIMTQTWKSSGLRRDLGNETAYLKDWSLIKPVWHKTMFPETTFYQTDKLIDTYLVNMFKNGKINDNHPNPIEKYLKEPYMDKTKIMLLKRLYKSSKDLDIDQKILKSASYIEFKSKFDLEAMKKSIETLEQHYKNAFFKRFWTDERKIRFSNALNTNIEIAKRNIEISDTILTKAMDSVFEFIE